MTEATPDEVWPACRELDSTFAALVAECARENRVPAYLASLSPPAARRSASNGCRSIIPPPPRSAPRTSSRSPPSATATDRWSCAGRARGRGHRRRRLRRSAAWRPRSAAAARCPAVAASVAAANHESRRSASPARTMSVERDGTATAFAPATVSNVACGFDVLGFAVAEVGDRVTRDRHVATRRQPSRASTASAPSSRSTRAATPPASPPRRCSKAQE